MSSATYHTKDPTQRKRTHRQNNATDSKSSQQANTPRQWVLNIEYGVLGRNCSATTDIQLRGSQREWRICSCWYPFKSEFNSLKLLLIWIFITASILIHCDEFVSKFISECLLMNLDRDSHWNYPLNSNSCSNIDI